MSINHLVASAENTSLVFSGLQSCTFEYVINGAPLLSPVPQHTGSALLNVLESVGALSLYPPAPLTAPVLPSACG